MKIIKKSVTKKTVAKKPIMKMGGAKKNLKKAQYGRQQGPLTEDDTKFLDKKNNMNVPTPYSSTYDRKKIANTPSNQEYYAGQNAGFRKSMEEDLREGFVPEGMYSSFEQKKGGSMKTIKKYQKGSEVKGSKGGKASQIIAGISATAAGAAGIGKNISNRRKAKKTAEEKAKMEALGKENPLKSAGYLDVPNDSKGYLDKQKKKTGGATRKMQKGGPNVIQSMRKNMLNNKENRLIDRGVKNMNAGNVEKGRAQFEKSNDVAYKRRHLADKYKTGGTKKYQEGGSTSATPFEKRQAKKIVKAKTKATVAEIEGEGTVSQKRDNRAKRVSTMAGTARTKTPRRLSTSNSTSTSTTDNRNSGNTRNTTNSGSSSGSNSGATGGAGGRSGSSSGVDNSRKSSTSVRQSQDNSRTTNVKNTSNTNVRQSQNNSRNTSVNQSQDNSINKGRSTSNDNSTKTNNSRKNTQVGKGNTSTKNSNYKKGGSVTPKAKMGGNMKKKSC